LHTNAEGTIEKKRRLGCQLYLLKQLAMSQINKNLGMLSA